MLSDGHPPGRPQTWDQCAYVAGCACKERREHQRQRMARHGRLLHGGDLGPDCGSVPFDPLVTCCNAFPRSAASFAIASLFSMGTPRPSVCTPAEALFVVLI